MRRIQSLALLVILLMALASMLPLLACAKEESVNLMVMEWDGSRGRLGHSQEHSIVTPKGGDTLSSGTNQTIVVKTSSGIKKVEISISGPVSVPWTDITATKVGYYFYYKWEVPSSAGEYTITARETYARRILTSSIKVTVVTTIAIAYELFIEIDYMEGHKPTDSVLAYITSYYYGRGINVTFYVNDTVPYDSSVTDAEFWAIEATFNNMGNDPAGGNPNTGVYTSKWKWVLYGTAVEGYPNVVGYIYGVGTYTDLLAGNYAFIADEVADSWSVTNKVDPSGAEAVVVMHEFGHAIGIAKLSWGREVYDPDRRSVMSTLSVYNAIWYNWWYYSADYWATKNLGYYAK